MKYLIRVIPLLLFSFCLSQGFWVMSGQTHPELDWETIGTEHFRVHYHQGLEDIALKGATIAEQVYPILLAQMGITETPVIDIIFTAEDEVLNGYAMWTNQTFIWVDQNDAAIWLEDEKWIFQVLSHELQHIIFFNAIKTWVPEPFNTLFSGCPTWFVEGLAEYGTERWRPYRADLSHKSHIYQNTVEQMDGHHDGFSKVLLLTELYGDSTLIEIVSNRSKFKTWSFKKAFRKATQRSVGEFNEEWRRVMNTYYYGFRAQKERYEDLGQVDALPVDQAAAFLFAPDSSRFAAVGRMDGDQWDQSLIISTRQEEEDQQSFSLFSFKSKTENEDKPKPPVFEAEEVDFGRFHSELSWSPDGKQLVYAKYHFGSYSSMIYDLRIYDIDSGKSRWLTQDERASHPAWSPDGSQIVYVAHQRNISNLYMIDIASGKRTALTEFDDDIQLLTPRWSPDGNRLSLAIADAEGNCDIAVINMDNSSAGLKTVTAHTAVDYRPIWHPDGTSIYFTSHRGGVPNIHRADLVNNTVTPVTDTGDGIWGIQWTPNGNSILGQTLSDVDSVRIVYVDPDRQITTTEVNIRPSFASWQTRTPDLPLTHIDQKALVDVKFREPYKAYKYPKHLTSFILPLDVLLGATMWTDALGKHLMQVIGGTTWNGKYPYYLFSYVNAQTGPIWGINLYHNVNWNFRFYDQSDTGLWEKFDGGSIWTTFNFNRGHHLNSNHTLTFALASHHRGFEDVQDYNEDLEEYEDHPFVGDNEFHLPQPESGREGPLSVNYRWINRRPHKSAISLPRNGFGINLHLDHADESLLGEYSYSRFSWDTFINIGLGQSALFLRGTGEMIDGTPFVQDYVGITRDMSIYGSGSSGALGFRENHNLRGFDDNRMGDRLVKGTMELRFPLMPELPVEFFGISLGEVSGAIFSDAGNAWYEGDIPIAYQDAAWESYVTNERDQFITTAGYEAKIAIRLGSSPLFFVAVGEANQWKYWDQEKGEPDHQQYVRFGLINPF